MNEQALAIHASAAPPIAPSGEQVLQSAEQVYRRLLADQPRHFRALCGLAVLRGRLGAVDEARGLLDRAAMAARRRAEDHVTLGTAYGRINDLERARRHFEEALAIDPNSAEARQN